MAYCRGCWKKREREQRSLLPSLVVPGKSDGEEGMKERQNRDSGLESPHTQADVNVFVSSVPSRAQLVLMRRARWCVQTNHI